MSQTIKVTGETQLDEAVVSDKPLIRTAENNGSTIFGDGYIENTQEYGDYMDRAAMLVRCGQDGKSFVSWRGDDTATSRPTTLTEGRVGWLFPAGSEGQLYPPLATRFLPGQKIPPKGNDEFIYAHRAFPATVTGKQLTLQRGHGFVNGQTLWLTDGPAPNECVGEFVRIAEAAAGSVTLTQAPQRQYTQCTAIAAPYAERMWFTGLSFYGALGTVIVQNAHQIGFTNVYVPKTWYPDPPPVWMHLLGCGMVSLTGCDLPGLNMSAGHDVMIDRCKMPHVQGEQGQIGVVIKNSQIGSLDTRIGCKKWYIKDTVFYKWLCTYDNWQLTSLDVGGTMRIRGENTIAADLNVNGPLVVEKNYQGAPPNAARNVTLDLITAHYVELLPGTSGRITRCSAPVVCNDPATRKNWTVNGVQL